jgi:hypothetical protein
MGDKTMIGFSVVAAVLVTAGLLLPGAPPASATTRAAPRVFRGAGFDACQAPDLATMEAWRAHSSYRAVGIYYGGRSRACGAQPHLTAGWVRRTDAAGWRLLPVYAGSQSPCAVRANPHPIDAGHPAGQGAREAADAVRRARALDIAAGSPLYLDMEAYDTGKPGCASATLAFIRAWDQGVARAGYLSGFYSSADSGAAALERARERGVTHLPDAVWYARWGTAPTVGREPALAEDAWAPNARVHQYAGAVAETHGRRRLTVDRDAVDAPVAVVGP